MATIYRKTAKGQHEIETRAARLPPRLRGALIVVDGRRSDDELRKLMLQEPDATLRALADQGFIEAISITPDAPRPASAPAPAAATPLPAVTVAPAAGAASAPPANGQAMPALSFEALRSDLVRSFTDLVGPMAEALALKMERSRSTEELRPLVEVAQRIVANSRGNQAAASFGAKFHGSLGH